MHTILYPVNALHHAGAEQQLLALVRGLDKERYCPLVAPLYSGGSLDAQFRAVPGVTIIDLDRRGKYDPAPLWKLGAILRRERVAIIQPFLTPSTFFGLIPALAMRTPVKIVTERCGVRKSRGVGYKTYRTAEDWLTRFADSVVPNSQAGADLLRERRIADKKIQTIYNGLDRARLQPDPVEIAAHRARFGVPPGGKVVGILATLTPAKDHATFLRAFADPAETAKLVANARQLVKIAFSHEGMVAQYEELYVRLLAAHQRATTPPIRRAPAEGSAE